MLCAGYYKVHLATLGIKERNKKNTLEGSEGEARLEPLSFFGKTGTSSDLAVFSLPSSNNEEESQTYLDMVQLETT